MLPCGALPAGLLSWRGADTWRALVTRDACAALTTNHATAAALAAALAAAPRPSSAM